MALPSNAGERQLLLRLKINGVRSMGSDSIGPSISPAAQCAALPRPSPTTQRATRIKLHSAVRLGAPSLTLRRSRYGAPRWRPTTYLFNASYALDFSSRRVDVDFVLHRRVGKACVPTLFLRNNFENSKHPDRVWHACFDSALRGHAALCPPYGLYIFVRNA